MFAFFSAQLQAHDTKNVVNLRFSATCHDAMVQFHYQFFLHAKEQ